MEDLTGDKYTISPLDLNVSQSYEKELEIKTEYDTFMVEYTEYLKNKKKELPVNKDSICDFKNDQHQIHRFTREVIKSINKNVYRLSTYGEGSCLLHATFPRPSEIENRTGIYGIPNNDYTRRIRKMTGMMFAVNRPLLEFLNVNVQEPREVNQKAFGSDGYFEDLTPYLDIYAFGGALAKLHNRDILCFNSYIEEGYYEGRYKRRGGKEIVANYFDRQTGSNTQLIYHVTEEDVNEELKKTHVAKKAKEGQDSSKPVKITSEEEKNMISRLNESTFKTLARLIQDPEITLIIAWPSTHFEIVRCQGMPL